jgi:hypothetical protein
MKALDSDIQFQQAVFTPHRGKLLGSISWLGANCEAIGDQRSIKRLLWFSAAIIVCMLLWIRNLDKHVCYGDVFMCIAVAGLLTHNFFVMIELILICLVVI